MNKEYLIVTECEKCISYPLVLNDWQYVCLERLQNVGGVRRYSLMFYDNTVKQQSSTEEIEDVLKNFFPNVEFIMQKYFKKVQTV